MYIYIATNTLNDKQYVGKSVKNPYKSRISNHIRARGDSPAFHNAIQKYGADAFTWKVIHYPNASPETLNAIERWQIAKLNTRLPAGYNIAKGGEGFDSETARENALKRVAEGNHPFAGEKGSQLQRKRIAEGNHPLAGDNNPNRKPEGRERNRENNLKRIAEGNHPFAGEKGSQRSRENALKRIAEGNHHFAGEKGSQLSRENNLKRVAAGNHHFAGKRGSQCSRENALKRVVDGTNPFAGEKGSQLQRKRVNEGTHNFLKLTGDKNPMRDPKIKQKRWQKRQAKKSQLVIDFE
jgi:group I intron endonuclease